MHYLTSLLLLPLTFAAPATLPLAPRQDSTDSRIAAAMSQIFGTSLVPFHAASSGGGSAASASTSASTGSGGGGQGGTGTSVFFENCAAGVSVSRVGVEPCEGGTGAEGDACVFTQGKNYTITITFTSPADVTQAQARTGLASFDGDEQTAYSGQSFSACTYTSCPIKAGVEATYTYPFRTYAAPDFDRLVFNATNGIAGESIMCANVPVTFKAA